METVLILLILAAVFVAIKGCIIVEQQEVVIVQRLGKYKETLGYSEEWMTDFVYNVVLMAKEDAKRQKKEDK